MTKKLTNAATRELPLQTLAAAVKPGTVTADDRSVDVRFYSGERVKRYDWRTNQEFLLEFSLDPAHVRLERANKGAPVLDDHFNYSVSHVLGVIVEASVNGSEGIATLQFSGREDVNPVWQDIQDGILRNVSMGAVIHRMEDISEDDDRLPTFRAIDWELMEISITPIPADPNAQTLSRRETAHPCEVVMRKGTEPSAMEEPTMQRTLARRLRDAIQSQVTDQRTRDDVIKAMATRASLTAAEVEVLLLDEDTEEQKRPKSIGRQALRSLAIELELEDKVVLDAAKEDGLKILAADPAATPAPAPAPAPSPEPPPAAVVPLSQVRDLIQQARVDERQAERERAARIRKDCQLAGLDADFANRMVDSELTVEQVMSAALEERSRRDRLVDTVGHISMGLSESDKLRPAIESSLLHRHNPGKYELAEGGGDFRGMTLLELGRWCAERAGHRTTGLARIKVAELALHSTSDFSKVLANVANKTLRDAYDESPRTFQPIAREVTASDFKAIHRVQLGEAPNLDKVNEHGEFRRGSISEGEETYRVESYGKIIGITRQTIVNDDLNAFTRVPQLFGRSAARLESDVVWGLIVANGAMGDGVALFHANHNNLAGAGTVIATAGLDAGLAAIAKQKGLDGQAHLNLMGKFLIVPVAKRATALQNVGEMARQRIVATKSADLPVFADDLTVIAEPRLDDDSAISWYLAAGPDQVDIIEFAYLDGQRGVAIETREGFDVDGVEVKARLDFGAGVLDFRGLYKNPGA